MNLAQDRRAGSAAVRDAVNAMDADSARAEWMSSQVQVSTMYGKYNDLDDWRFGFASEFFFSFHFYIYMHKINIIFIVFA